MKNDNRGISKNQLFKLLGGQGITAKRNFIEQKWELSNGEKYSTLAEIAAKHSK